MSLRKVVSSWTFLYSPIKDYKFFSTGVLQDLISIHWKLFKNTERGHEVWAIEIKEKLSYFFYIPFMFLLIFDSDSGFTGCQRYLLIQKKANILNKASSIY